MLAPRFELPDLDGRMYRLDEFLDRPVLLVFMAPDCIPCDALAADLVALDARADLNVVVVARGTLEANRAKSAEHSFTFPVLLQKGWQVSKRYARFETPIAYLIDDHGVLIRGVARGRAQILALADEVAPTRTATELRRPA